MRETRKGGREEGDTWQTHFRLPLPNFLVNFSPLRQEEKEEEKEDLEIMAKKKVKKEDKKGGEPRKGSFASFLLSWERKGTR